MAKKRMAKAKAVNYILIPQDGEIGQPRYERLFAIVDAHHEDLSKTNARIALAWQLGLKPDVDGRLVLGRCRKATDLDRELAPFDFVILLNRDFWQNAKVTNEQRNALLDHELCHAAVAYDTDGDLKRDDRGRYVFRVRKHDLEEFRDVVARHGLYKNDLVDFERALRLANLKTDVWVGYTKLHEALKTIGVSSITREVIATWSDDERREVMTWAVLRQDAADGRTADVISLSQTVPACLAAALGMSTSGADTPAANAH
jgi:hypothetical protein